MRVTGKMSGWLAGLMLVQLQAAPLASAWIRVITPEMELLTSGDAQVAVEALEELEALRSDWRRLMSPWDPAAATRKRLHIVAFASEAEYEPFRVNAFSPAYFFGGTGQDTIVLGRLTRENFPALRHEFVHHLVRTRWPKLPLWLEEGLADFVGEIEPFVAQARGDRLRRIGLLPLRELALVEKSSAGYRDRELALQFYAQSWAMTSLLMTDPAYGGQVWSLVDRLSLGESLESAVGATYGRDLKRLEMDLAGHLGGATASGRHSRVGLAAAASAAADGDEVGLALAGVMLRKGDAEGAQRYLDGLASSCRSNPELWSLTADLAMLQDRPQDAQLALHEAMRLGKRDPRPRR